MSREDAIRLAEEAGIVTDDGPWWAADPEELERFYTLAQNEAYKQAA